MLEVSDVHTSYGAVAALRGVSLRVDAGELVGLVGSNGAGKTTLMRTIAGILKPTPGSIAFEGATISGLAPEVVVRRGISLVPEGRHIFPSLTIGENLRLGAATRRDKDEIRRDIDDVCTRFPILKERFRQAGGTLSGGEQQQLAIARALMARPRLLLLDEPSLGLAPIIVDRMFEIIKDLRQRGMTILLVEQNVRRTLAISDRAYLLNAGGIVFGGSPDDLLREVDVESAYLGKVGRPSARTVAP